MSKALAKVTTGDVDRGVAEGEAMWDAVPVAVEDAPTARVMPFANRFAAGRLLGQALAHHARTGAVVLGISPGGVAVAHGLASHLELKLDCWLVRKLIPILDPHLVLGVIAEGASLVLDRYGLARSGMNQEQVRALIKETADQMNLDARLFRAGEPAPNLTGKTVILVDDGITAGGTLAAAIEGVRRRFASKIVVASPVGSEAAVASLAAEVNECMCLMLPPRLRRVGSWYQDYRPISDQAVMKILASMPTA